MSACGSDLTPLARLPKGQNGVRTAPIFTQILTTIHHQNFFASKGSVCWSLLAPRFPLFTSWTASRCSGNPAIAREICLGRRPDYTIEAILLADPI